MSCLGGWEVKVEMLAAFIRRIYYDVVLDE
jgi:hypothetical protein